MMNINCSEKCIHERNGKCTLNHVTPISSFSTNGEADCAYFILKQPNKKTAPSN
ncbi:hydroxymyristoyl-ACP dehydratase [Clostridium aciditolerans]|nr:hydroxymyristoyl-ACP dehydratase [Clostridium aciditolerans]